MDNILPAYNDPLFSILIIVVLVLLVAIISVVMGNVKEDRKRKSLKRFLNSFNTNESLLEIEEMPFNQSLVKPLTLLAYTFKNQGEFQKAINLNLYLINHIPSFIDKEEILEQLGQTYLKAGFLKRAESVFLQILHKRARNKEVLYNLGIVYELLHEYDKALDTIRPLEVLGEETQPLEAHLRLHQLLTDRKVNSSQKVEKLVAFLEDENYSYRPLMKALFQLDRAMAWQNIKSKEIHSIIDILWFLPTSNLNFDIISSEKTLRAIFVAKGHLEANGLSIEKSNIFAIDTIISAQQGGNYEVDITFTYGCQKCKQHFPIAFTRCPKCYAIDTIQIKETVAKKQSQTGYSLL